MKTEVIKVDSGVIKGKTKKINTKNGGTVSAVHYRGHHVTAGVRFDI